MKPAASAHLVAWLNRRDEPQAERVRLTQGRVYILPTRSGLLLGMTLVLMLLGCINYNLGLGYVLTFLLAGVALVSILHTVRNLARLELLPGRVEPVFAGDTAAFAVLLRNSTPLARFSVGVTVIDTTGLGSTPGGEPGWRDLEPGQTLPAEVHLEAAERGRLRLPRLRVFTTFPLGLFYAWSNVHLDMSCLVYPRPEAGEVPLPPPQSGEGQGSHKGRGQDDFAGLRRYQPGDSPRQVAWKAVARGQHVLTKQFTGAAVGQLWLSWSLLPANLRLEAKLSRLTRWIVDAAAEGLPFGFDVPGTLIPPAAGQSHEVACLTTLALFKGHR